MPNLNWFVVRPACQSLHWVTGLELQPVLWLITKVGEGFINLFFQQFCRGIELHQFQFFSDHFLRRVHSYIPALLGVDRLKPSCAISSIFLPET